MPYTKDADLPDAVKDNLPKHAQDIWREAYDSANDEYADPKKRTRGGDREEVAVRVAWAAVEHEYHKDEKTGKWVEGARESRHPAATRP
jgi:cation transport regulator